jgi:hypothetical protein
VVLQDQRQLVPVSCGQDPGCGKDEDVRVEQETSVGADVRITERGQIGSLAIAQGLQLLFGAYGVGSVP